MSVVRSGILVELNLMKILRCSECLRGLTVCVCGAGEHYLLGVVKVEVAEDSDLTDWVFGYQVVKPEIISKSQLAKDDLWRW